MELQYSSFGKKMESLKVKDDACKYGNRGFDEFTQGTSLHGIKYTTNTLVPYFVRLFWFLILVGFFLFCLTMMSHTFKSYINHESVSSTEKILGTNLKQPVVTICNFNMMKKSYVQKWYPEVYNMQMRILHGNTNISDELRNYYIRISKNVTLLNFLDKTCNKLEDMIMHCEFAGKKLNCSKYFERFRTSKGYCLSFQSKEVSERNGGLDIADTGPDFGVTMTLDANVEEYYRSSSISYGFMIQVHDQDTYPLMEHQGFVVSPGSESYIAIQKNINIRLPKPYSDVDCIDRTNEIHRNYSYEQCRHNNSMHSVFEENGCHGYDDCTLYNLPSMGFSNTTTQATPVIEKCKPNCHEIYYTSKITTAKFADDNSANLNMYAADNWPTQNLSYIHQNYAHIKIYFDTMYIFQSKQIPAHTWESFIGSVGGQLGVCLGASILTLIEFIEYGICFIYKCYSKIKANVKTRYSAKVFQEMSLKHSKKDGAT